MPPSAPGGPATRGDGVKATGFVCWTRNNNGARRSCLGIRAADVSGSA